MPERLRAMDIREVIVAIPAISEERRQALLREISALAAQIGVTGEDLCDMLRTLIAESGVASPDRVLISQWKVNKWIEQIDKFQYRKLI